MSFILDALRKSEYERQRQTAPGVSDLRTAATVTPKFPIWAVAVAALLAVNLIVVLILVIRGDFRRSTPVVPAPSEASSSAPMPSAPPASTSTQNRVAENSASIPGASSSDDVGYAQSAPVLPPAETGGSTGVGGDMPRAGLPAPAQPSDPLPAPPDYSTPLAETTDTTEQPKPAQEPRLFTPSSAAKSVAAPRPAGQTEYLPSLSDVLAKGGNVPSEWHLDIHVYAPRPADRFIFLNKNKYREGNQTTEGATVERISPDGVVLNFRGTRFLLPRE